MTPFAVIARWTEQPGSTTEVERLMDAVGGRCSEGANSITVPGASVAFGLRAVSDKDRLSECCLVDPKRRRLIVGDVRLYGRAALEDELGGGAGESQLALVGRAFDRFGDEAPARLVGDFAFVVWDWGDMRLFAARDHFGLRSLHYRTFAGGIALATDSRQLFLMDPENREIDPVMALDYLLTDYVHLGRSFFRQVQQVRPAHRLVAMARGLREERFWRPPNSETRVVPYEETIEEWRALFRNAVRDRLESEYPIVAHLSGGLDSGSIVGAAHAIYEDTVAALPPLTTMSAQFPGLDCDETQYINAVTEKTHLFDSVRWNGADPNFGDLDDPTIAIPGLRRGPGGGQRRDMQVAMERDARVFITGTGGDDVGWARGVFRDLFASGQVLTIGREILALPSWSRMKQHLRDGLNGVIPSSFATRACNPRQPQGPMPSWLGPVLAQAFRERGDANDSDVGLTFTSHTQREIWKALHAPQASICVDMLAFVGAEAGLETRMPYLDVRLVDFVLGLSWRSRLPHGDMRRLQRDAVTAFLPTKVSTRMIKPNFGSAILKHARQGLQRVREILHDSAWTSAPYVNLTEARKLLADLILKDPGFENWRQWRVLWQIASFEAWRRAVLVYNPRERKTNGQF